MSTRPTGTARVLGAADTVVVAVTFWMRVLAGLMILVMTVTTVFDVVMRYVFASPTTWALTLNAALILAATFLAVPHLAAVQGHIDMDLFYRRFSARTRRLLDVVGGAVTFVFAALLAWLGYRATYGMWRSELYTSGNFALPVWTLYLVIYLGGLGLALVILLSPWRRRPDLEDETEIDTSQGAV